MKTLQKLLNLFEQRRVFSIAILSLLFVLILFPRFNRNDIPILRPFVGLAPGELSLDQQNYYNFTEYFKSQNTIESVSTPYSYRPLLPFISSLLPFDSLLSISIVSILSLIVSMWASWLTIKKLGFAQCYSILSLFLFVLSFPLFYYGSGGYLEPFSNMIIYLIVLATVYNNTTGVVLLFIIGAATKETTIIALPFVLLYALVNNKKNKTSKMKALLITIIIFAVFIATNLIIRKQFGVSADYVWTPAYHTIMENITRPKTYLSFILSFGLPGLFSTLLIGRLLKSKNTLSLINQSPYILGGLSAILISFYSVIAAYADGRFVWTGYPFFIILSAVYLKLLIENSNPKSA